MPLASFRVDASDRIGSGHLVRCLVLAQQLRGRGFACSFACRELPGHGFERVEAAGFELLRLPAGPDDSWQQDAGQTLAAIAGTRGRVDWLVVDHYRLDARWESALRQAAGAILAIDDLADRDHAVDLLLDQNLVAGQQARYRDRLGADTPVLLGPRYALLQPEYAALHAQAQPRRGPVRRLLANFGGADAPRLCSRALAAFLRLDPPGVELDVVAPLEQLAQLRELAGRHPRVHVHGPLPTLAPLVAFADLALGAGGVASWERLCLGLPALVVTLADNQRPIAEELHRRGLLRYLGHEDAVDEQALATALAAALAAGCDEEASRRGLELVDGEGAARVTAAMLAPGAVGLHARSADAGDEALLLRWANDPGTRANAFHPEPIPPDVHHAWLGARLAEAAGCRLFVVEDEAGEPLGSVRFQHEGEAWEIHFALAPEARGRGLGRALVQAGLRRLRADNMGPKAVIGQVKPGNAASRRIFETLGFEQAEPLRTGTILYRRPL